MRHILFLCTANSARTLMAEAILTAEARGRIEAHSAGLVPAAKINSGAAEILRAAGRLTPAIRPKGIDIFGATGAPEMDVVVALATEGRDLPGRTWRLPGSPEVVEWILPSRGGPGGVAAMTDSYQRLIGRMTLVANLPLERLDRRALSERLALIGQYDR
ncbi:hypothetical protein [Pseudoroseicyclus sp. CXY001]|uniref:arsenate reductase/protein-tyrosine-phosphatase family protein n=1 Tax=Pseudoroseicyclus sp. CXY001 TaxID=3242492 RepID=UPI00358DAB86